MKNKRDQMLFTILKIFGRRIVEKSTTLLISIDWPDQIEILLIFRFGSQKKNGLSGKVKCFCFW